MPENPEKPSLDPAALTVEQAAGMLSAASGRTIPPETVQAAVDAGAPVGADGRIHLVELMAWLEQQLAQG